MTKPIRIGILGSIGAGKDTVAKIIQSVWYPNGKEVPIVKYADLLKQQTAILFSCQPSALEGRHFKETAQVISAERWSSFRAEGITKLAADLYIHPESWLQAVNTIQALHPHEITPRRFMQLYGNAMRSYNSHVWVDALQAKHKDLICSDVRFENELLDLNILVYGENDVKSERPEHSSEHFAWDLVHSTYPKTGTDAPIITIRNKGYRDELALRISVIKLLKENNLL